MSKNTIQQPILEKTGYKTWGTPRGEYAVKVWRNPNNPKCFSYSIAIGNGVRSNPCPICDNSGLFGCFPTPQSALQAGIEDL